MTTPVLKYMRPKRSNPVHLLTALLFCVLSSTGFANPKNTPLGQTVLGWIEPVGLASFEHPVEAKIDSGADHSSLHATDIRIFEQGQTAWVRFHSVQNRVLTRPLVRKAAIKLKNAPAETRPVVAMRICIDRQWLDIQVNLVDRDRFKQSMLIGRSALPEGILIDPNRIRLTQPRCEPEHQKTVKPSGS